MANTDERQQLRSQMRARRRALSAAAQTRAGIALATHLSQHLWFRQAHHIAFYLPNDGEIDTRPLLQLSWALGKQCYLPVVTDRRQLHFRQVREHTRLVNNRYGIAEPPQGAPYRPHWLLNLILLPLVAFDPTGNRLGMGGGYYDRTFASHPHRPRPSGRRLGLAHSCQRVSALTRAHWDIPLHAIATESKLLPVSR